MVPPYQSSPGSLPAFLLETERHNLRQILLLCKHRTQDVAGLQDPGDALSLSQSILRTCSFTQAKQGTFHSLGQAGGGSRVFSTLCSVGSQWQDKTSACKLRVRSFLPLTPSGLQQFSEQIPSGMQAQPTLQHQHWRPHASPAKGKALPIWGWQESVLPPPPRTSRIHPLQPQICASSDCSHSGQSEVRKPVPQHLPALQAARPAPGHKPCSKASPDSSHSALEKKKEKKKRAWNCLAFSST